MKNKQAQQYFQQLKKIEKAKTILLPQIINILTGGSVSITQFKIFCNELASNQFGQFNHVEQNIKKGNWKQMNFSTINQIILAVKSYIAKKKPQKKTVQNQVNNDHTISSILDGLKIMEVSVQQIQQQQMQKKWKKSKMKLLKKLHVIFDYYRKQRHVEGETFQNNISFCQNFDIRLFMKYFKAFDLKATYSVQQVTKSFKRNAINTIWLNFDGFVNVHLDLIDFKQQLSNKQRYFRVKGLNDLISAQKIKTMMNLRMKDTVQSTVREHTGTYKQDIINFLQQKQKERREKLEKKWSHKSIQARAADQQKKSLQNSTERSELKLSVVSKSLSKIKRSHTEEAPSVYDELKLPKLRLKQHRDQSIYKQLKFLNVGSQQQKIKKLVFMNQDEQFLNQYLKKQGQKNQKKPNKPKNVIQLPSMRFS